MKTNKELMLLQKESRDKFIPVIRKKTAKILKKLIKNKKINQILEIGTCVGFSGSLMLTTNKSAFLTTIDKDKEVLKIADENFKKFEVDSRATIICDDAINAISRLEISDSKFDFILLDGPKGQYVKYMPHLISMLNVNGILFADDVLFYNLVEKEGKIIHKHRTIVTNLRKFIDEMKNNKNFKCKLKRIEDGFMICKKVR
ncbi:MAG: class I SAM-dependent methyltransferase [Clostridia bacterium]|nr:class I SAM-dependent methyltransferase [Clostridia bacterium]